MRCVQADLLRWQPDRRFDLWHDRAAFHFLVDAVDQGLYLDTMRHALAPGGSVVIGAFAADAPEMCSGLPVQRYSVEGLSTSLGDDFELVATRREEHVTPRGAVQPFTWIAGRFG